MEKIRKALMRAAMIVVAVTTLTSCQTDDAAMAYDLNGIWEGVIQGDFYSWRYDSSSGWETQIQFVQHDDFANGGTGREVDYYSRTGRTSAVNFRWEVRNGLIYIFYNDGTRVVIHDYELYSSRGVQRFRGYFDDLIADRTLASFDLVKVESWRW